ncbi:hypothetical protein [Scytonema sp. NUACC26]|uniref:hypothetical protein n=1 Tax=Scytonema sp. NUACC26 TaxID=3140176 RepID=UPI0034DBD7A7
MLTAICTLFEKDYHYGVGILVNSLYQYGFRGVIWAGYRGNLPSWAKSAPHREGYQELSLGQESYIRFVKLDTNKHFAYYKPDFMLELWEKYHPEAEAIFYFDPDIVNKCRWDFYEHWVKRGIALCGDSWYYVPRSHPRRLAWLEFAQSKGFDCKQQLDYHYNSGFIGVHRDRKSIVSLWQKLITLGDEAGYINYQNLYSDENFHCYPYLYGDQTYLNLALMLTNEPLSAIGPEGMDFIPGGTTMSHATVPSVKPWRKKLIASALNGDSPTMTDRVYWQHTQTPIPVYSKATLFLKQLDLRGGSAIGRFMRRAAI